MKSNKPLAVAKPKPKTRWCRKCGGAGKVQRTGGYFGARTITKACRECGGKGFV